MSVSSEPTSGSAPLSASQRVSDAEPVGGPALVSASESVSGPAPAVAEAAGPGERSLVLTEDLHARPASALAQAAAKFASTVTLTYGSRSVDVRSVLSLMGLGATSGQSVTLRATGADAAEAVAALSAVLGA